VKRDLLMGNCLLDLIDKIVWVTLDVSVYLYQKKAPKIRKTSVLLLMSFRSLPSLF